VSLLDSLEQFLLGAVDAALPGPVVVSTGPWAQAAGVYIHASKLVLEPLGEDPPEDADANLVTIHEWPSNGSTVNFELPPELGAELLDVEAPPGYLATRGDHYFINDRTICFYRPPAPGDPGVRTRVQGAAARGYRRRRRCSISFELNAIEPDLADVDAWLETAIQASLIRLLDLPVLTSSAHANVQMRVQVTHSSLESIQRELVADISRFRATATFELRGELELIVATGTPEPVGIISSIELAPTISQPSPEPEAESAPPAPAPIRPIMAKPVTMLADISNTTATELAELDPPVSTIAELTALDVDAVSLTDAAAMRTHVKRAKLVLATFASGIPALPPAALTESLDDLLELSLIQLGALTGLGTEYAQHLREDLSTLDILLTDPAKGTLTLTDFR
jgi:hypothetical protein